jgi:hypothetical protein
LLEDGKSPLEARDALLEAFDVDTGTLERDLESLLEDLAAQGLVSAA